MPVVGTCPLCQTENVLLCRSHLEFPRFVYKALRDENNALNKNPIHITREGVEQTQRQNWRHLLCRMCENERFNGLGERHVARISLKTDGSFPLMDMIRDRLQKSDGRTRYYDATDTAVPHQQLVYFALSMLWRSIFIHERERPIRLGPYEESIREYLLGGPPPQDVSIHVIVRNTSPLTQTSHSMYLRAKGLVGRVYAFSIPGITFHITLGKHRYDETRTGCLLHGEEKLILESLVIEEALDEQTRRQVRKAEEGGKIRVFV
ncbi:MULTISPECIES: hypothetical protein [Acidobacteriaceae]|uniref:hypothetical protein n=1 Tax=Acidobacteriaceae TaxID=204434 RepID=UPI00131C867C|nr:MULTISPECIES: hypothetical protein [Acidobacteriaceae]MDW5264651.1 hypothetical protein [Edaphobacter sp.]